MLASKIVRKYRTRCPLLSESNVSIVIKITPEARQDRAFHGELSPPKQVVMKTNATFILMSHGMTKGTTCMLVNHNRMPCTQYTSVCISTRCLYLRYVFLWVIKPF